jgi:hypothetical protein
VPALQAIERHVGIVVAVVELIGVSGERTGDRNGRVG